MAEELPHLKRVLFIPIVASGESLQEPDYVQMLRDDGHYVEVRQVLEGSTFPQICRAFLATSGIGKFDLVIAQEYMCAFGLCLRGALSWKRPMMAAVGFNVSRRYLSTSSSFINKFINSFFRCLSLAVVHSHAERNIFIQKHDLRPDQLAVALFGFDIAPVPRAKIFEQGKPFDGAPYICMVGRNNRDFATLQRAIRGTGIPAIFVASKTNYPGLVESDKIKLMFDLAFDECLEIIQNARLAVLLLKNDHRGAGHMTAVSGMMLAKPHVFSDAEVLKGYLTSGQHGISVPLGAWEETRDAIVQLYNNIGLAEEQGSAAREYARAHLSNHAFQRRIHSLLHALLEDRAPHLRSRR